MPPRKCSQLSSTSTVGIVTNAPTSASIKGRAGLSRTPIASPIVERIRTGSEIEASSTHTTLLSDDTSSWATASASRVLPTPPGPTNVSRDVDSLRSNVTTRCRSASRPMSCDREAGRLAATPVTCPPPAGRTSSRKASFGRAARAIAIRCPESSSNASASKRNVSGRGVVRFPVSNWAIPLTLSRAFSANASWLSPFASRQRRRSTESGSGFKSRVEELSPSLDSMGCSP